MGFCLYCGNWVSEGGICETCGRPLMYPSPDDHKKNKKESEQNISSQEYFCREARICSIKGDHLTAIKFYKEALRSMFLGVGEWDMLSAIAGEYEAMGNYDCAQEYWNKCREIEDSSPWYAPGYIAERGNFLYRRGQYEEAIETYEKALNAVKVLKAGETGLDKVKICARISHFSMDSYYMLGEDKPEEKYHNELKDTIDKYIQTRKFEGNENKTYYLSEAAWELYADGMSKEALVLIDSAIELHPDCPAEYCNRKAIMLEGYQFEEALKYYDIALSKERGNETYLGNKANCIREELKTRLLLNTIEPHDLDLIDEAMEILPESYDNGPYLFTKSEILNELGEPIKAKFCAALSIKNYDEAEKAERQLKKLKPSETYINITGTQYYQGFTPFREGIIVDLIREPDNPHDPNAIRVEIGGETVGYVANSEYTLIKEVKSAADIKEMGSARAEVQFILFNEWVIAKLI